VNCMPFGLLMGPCVPRVMRLTSEIRVRSLVHTKTEADVDMRTQQSTFAAVTDGLA